jgi:hypothetical protein
LNAFIFSVLFKVSAKIGYIYLHACAGKKVSESASWSSPPPTSTDTLAADTVTLSLKVRSGLSGETRASESFLHVMDLDPDSGAHARSQQDLEPSAVVGSFASLQERS